MTDKAAEMRDEIARLRAEWPKRCVKCGGPIPNRAYVCHLKDRHLKIDMEWPVGYCSFFCYESAKRDRERRMRGMGKTWVTQHPRGVPHKPKGYRQFTCEVCGKSFGAWREAMYCSPACKQKAWRRGQKEKKRQARRPKR
jgi:hypothetical protein